MVMVANAEKDVVICGDNSRDSDEVPMRILESQECGMNPARGLRTTRSRGRSNTRRCGPA